MLWVIQVLIIMKKKSHLPITKTKNPEPPKGGVDWLIWAAWADRVTFETIKEETGLSEGEVIKTMRSYLKPKSFQNWRKRARHKSIKHGRKFQVRRKKYNPKYKDLI